MGRGVSRRRMVRRERRTMVDMMAMARLQFDMLLFIKY